MAHMVGPTGKVYAVEHIEDLVAQANKSMHTYYPNLMEGGRVQFVDGDGREGHAAEGPYDVIYVGGAVHHYPFKLVEQLKPCSRMYIPIGLTTETQNWETIEKYYDGVIGRRKLLKTAFPYLKDAKTQMKIHLSNFVYPC
ncbi:protein-L-isoaspartate(D-aspartate) O-methyltransferase-like [Diaphorina citri]|uniref:protein-L-isoaspartate(D-aspartate) O-methyltransferase n=1 Tax=Diaphorina citri TaxID=121845 RepID=A0A3Q0IRH1_DIACI|nr:protein-L-isoaspartate(D-aspartate) O-methyltransferase-like [Diaphorina citri]